MVFPLVMILLAAAGTARAEATAPKTASGDAIVVTHRRLHEATISPLIYGNFMELLSDLVPSMWAEKLDVTSFEYLRTPEELRLREPRFAFDPRFDPRDRFWSPLGDKAHAEWFLDPEQPYNGRVAQRIRLTPGGGEAGIGQEGIFVEKGKEYRFVGHFRQQGAGAVHVELRRHGQLLAAEAIPGITTEWSQRGVTLRPSATATDATLVIRITTSGTLWIDRLSLMPAETVDGWRPDVVAAIRAMRPGIIRWGGTANESYQWQQGVGPWQNRVPFPNLTWGRIDPNFVGIDEFIAFCRAVQAEPLVCVRWTGRQPADAAALVEYCNGPATSHWGSFRARHGHPAAYHVRYWQIGNEVGGAAYDASIAAFAQAMHKADPAIKLLSSYVSKPMLRSAGNLLDYVCPHLYNCGNLTATEAVVRQYTDLLRKMAPRRPIKLAVTEWNTTGGMKGPGRHTLWTLANGLACARYLNLCHRHADMIQIACRSNISNSYCSGIIQTNNHSLFCTPAYYVSRLYAEHAGSQPLEIGNPASLSDLDVSANLGTDGKTLSLIVVNTRNQPLTKLVDVGALGQIGSTVHVGVIADADDARDTEAANSFQRPERICIREATEETGAASFRQMFPAYSVTVVRLDVSRP